MGNLLTIPNGRQAGLEYDDIAHKNGHCKLLELPQPKIHIVPQSPEPLKHFRKQFIVQPGAEVRLAGIDPGYHCAYESREMAQPEIRSLLHKLDQLQYMLYAEKKHSLLIVFQGLDACGKDGVIRHLLSGMNPAGCRVVPFKRPKPEELEHDFLWRIHPHVPAKGEVVIFNRSHYEDVLIVRVHHLAQSNNWSERYELINDFERLLAIENNTTILKFLLYISKKEQLTRFKQRLDDPTRRWKISEADYQERTYWNRYMEAFEDMLHKTSTRHAPWFVIPSNHKWFRDLAVSQIIADTIENLDLQLPKPGVDLAKMQHRYHLAEAEESRPDITKT
jgi:PPK2 family polyphosphate:nucleotide phosphotransferase